MRIVGINLGSGGRYILAASLWLALPAGDASAQFFDSAPIRPPADVPTGALGPAQSLAPPSGSVAPAPVPTSRGPNLQSLPATAPIPALPPGQVALALSARFGRDLPAITGGLHWRVYPLRPDANSGYRPLKEEKSVSPTFNLPPGGYVVSVGFGLASVTKPVTLRSDTVREVIEIPAGGLRIEGKVGDARIPPGQISFQLYKGSQFEAGDKRPIAQSVLTGDVLLLPEGTYHIVSNYGDGNAVVRSDIRVQTGKLTDATVTHRAAIITLKLVDERGGEARANTQWTVLTPGGDVIKEAIGAFPRVILADGDYRAIARNDDKTYERSFKVITGVDGEVEVLTR